MRVLEIGPTEVKRKYRYRVVKVKIDPGWYIAPMWTGNGFRPDIRFANDETYGLYTEIRIRQERHNDDL